MMTSNVGPTAPLCPHFGTCGGCASQDVPYDAQLAAKSAALSALLGERWPEPIPVHPSPRIWHYRNKVELNFGRKHYPEPPPPDVVKETVLGFKKRGAWYWTLNLDECRIGPAGLDVLMEAARRWYLETGARAWDGRRQDGLLRHLVVRVGQRTGERLVVLIARPGELDTTSFTEAVHRVWPDANVVLGLNPGRGDQAIAEELHVLSGRATIEEELDLDLGGERRRLRFRISPFSFFQTNTEATEHLYTRVRAWVAEVAPAVLYDLYGGAGGIAFACADLVERVESVESWEPASEDGVHNAAVNGITNVRFTAEAVERYLGRMKAAREPFPDGSAAVLDPPRAGLHPRAAERLALIGPEHLLYVSCNPKLFARELEVLGESYALTSAEAFDLFPHTPHVELVASLVRKH